nr:bet v I domain-containing protein [Tanacetum cinerariifolium]
MFKYIEGDLLEMYKTLTITFHVEPKDDKQLATWTFDYEKLDASIPDPTVVMDLLCGIIKDMSLEHEQERITVKFGALWRPVLALEAWAGCVDTWMTDMSWAGYDDHKLVHDMLL